MHCALYTEARTALAPPPAAFRLRIWQDETEAVVPESDAAAFVAGFAAELAGSAAAARAAPDADSLFFPVAGAGYSARARGSPSSTSSVGSWKHSDFPDAVPVVTIVVASQALCRAWAWWR